ncbi:MAG: hypothetical protein R3A79_22535 [Nannocystaceae bacterium]
MIPSRWVIARATGAIWRRCGAAALLVTACADGAGAPPDAPAAAADDGPASAAAEAPRSSPPEAAPGSAAITREGVLDYQELPRTKSVEAYMGVEFTLRGDGEETALAASEGVPREALVAHAGRRVRVTCTPREPTPADPRESAPTRPDGAPLERPAKCAVSALTAL